MTKTNNIFYLFKSFLLLLIFLHVNSSSLAQQPSITKDYYTLPFEFVENLPYLTVTIENFKVPLIVDTGASIAIHLSKNILSNLKNIQYTSNYSRTVDITGKIKKLPYFSLKQAEAFGYKATQITGVEYKPWGAYIDGTKLDDNMKNIEQGVIGLNFFKKNNLIIDYSKKCLVVLKTGSTHPEYSARSWHVSPLSASKNTLVVKATLDGKLCKFLIDTGSGGSVLRKTFLSNSEVDNQASITSNNLRISGKSLVALKLWLFDFADTEFDGILGYDFFSEYVVFLDFQNNVIKIS